MGTKPSLIAMALLSALASTPTLAANPDEHLVVIGRTPDVPLNIAADVAVINAEQIAASGATDLAGVLLGQSGIQISNNGIGPVFSMRGFASGQAANNTLILLDGRRLNNIDIAAPSLSAIAINQIERIEILSGSAGVLYGDQAVGGVINIITKRPDKTSAGVSVAGGSFDAINTSADVGGKFADNWYYFLGASYDKSDNYREHSASKTGSLVGRLSYITDVNEFFAEASLFDDNRELAGSLTEAEFEANPRQANPNNSQDYNHDITKASRLGYSHVVTNNWSLGAEVSASDTRVNYVSWGGQGTTERSWLLFSPKATGSYQTQKGELSIVTGLDISRGESDFISAFMDRSNVQKQFAAFVQASVPLTERLSYVVGGRYATVTDDIRDMNTYPVGGELDNHAHALELGLNYRLTEGQRLYVRAEDNFRFAKVDEQAYTSSGSLKPQTGRSYEAGWDLNANAHNLRLSVYRLTLEDEIVFDPSAPTPPGGAFPGSNINADASRRYGAALDWQWQLTDALTLGADYQYIDAKFTAGVNAGKELSWVASHSGRVFTTLNIHSDWQLYADVAYTGKRWVEGDNANQGEPLAAVWLSNLALNYNLDKVTASLRVDNLFDEQYVSSGYFDPWGNGYYPGEGRKVSLGLSLRY